MAKATFTPFAAKLTARISSEVDKALDEIGDAIRETAADSVIEGGIPSPNHIPSMPGEPPNADTHVLDQSIRKVPVENHRVEVEATAPYARGLEYGTSRVEERPFMRPALAKNKSAAGQRIQEAIRRATDA